MRLSIITPAFNEEASLPALHQRLARVMQDLRLEWEWLVVDDHSRDATFGAIQGLAAVDARVRGIRLARNRGSHVAITCGLHHATGDIAVVMAADLQDPPETLDAMLRAWRDGAQIVWATRRERPGDRTHAGFAALYYWIMRRVIGLTELPARGADFFLADRVVLDAYRRYAEHGVSVFALLTSMGFRQAFIEYDKQPRAAGHSGWTLTKKVALVADSVAGFSALPLRACLWLGTLLLGLGTIAGIGGLLAGASSPSLLLAALAGATGLQLVATGAVGEYVWRTLQESRRRPVYLIEAATDGVCASIQNASAALE